MKLTTKIYNKYKWKDNEKAEYPIKALGDNMLKYVGQKELAKQHNTALRAAINETEKLAKGNLLQILLEIRKAKNKPKQMAFYKFLEKKGMTPSQYYKELVRKRGYKNIYEYQKDYAIKHGYKSRWDMWFNKYSKKKWARPIDMLNERAKRNGYKDYKDYENALAKKRGYADRKSYRRMLAQRGREHGKNK